ncbi:hypothetical protein [Cohnella silvisoli]|uniref:Alpha-galactosidase n=1 Tax=Cohnella silvisoli TaxID=2873699 RepID=A0ABV1KSX1_9BACL|nr:hypothetical protein [Cohnella silvisoli]MCD9021462.1 hypothetical protein [Cohnella silvisoli]
MAIELLREPDSIVVRTETRWSALDNIGFGVWNKEGVQIQAVPQSDRLTIGVEAGQIPLMTVKINWKIHIEGALRLLGDHWERAYGDLEWRGIVPERVMPWYFLTNDGETTCGYGVKTGASSFCYWQMDYEGVTLTLDIRCGNAGVILNGRVLHAATVVMMEGESGETSFKAAQRLCSIMCDNPVLPSEPVYGGNNWYYAYGNSSHSIILNDSRFIASLAPASGSRPFMIIDDGWQMTSGRGACNGGPWEGNFLFPDMRRLASEMREIGVRPGIWCRPLLVSERVPEHWVRYRNSENGAVLDPSLPEVLDYISAFISRMAGWGYELIKHDFTTFDLFGQWGFEMKGNVNAISRPFGDRSRTSAEIVLGLYKAIAKASGQSLVIGCNTVSHLAAGCFEIQRTGDDTSGKSWERTRYMGINTMAFRMPQHGTFYSHDADCIGITETVPWSLNSKWLELLAGSGTPLFVSADPAVVTKEQKAELRRAYLIASQPLPPGEPLDWLATTCPKHWLLNGEKKVFVWNDSVAGNESSEDNHWWL